MAPSALATFRITELCFCYDRAVAALSGAHELGPELSSKRIRTAN